MEGSISDFVVSDRSEDVAGGNSRGLEPIPNQCERLRRDISKSTFSIWVILGASYENLTRPAERRREILQAQAD